MPQPFTTTLARLRTARRDPGFQQELERLARLGTVAGAGLGLTAVLLFVGIYGVLLGKTPGWSYDRAVVALWDKTVLVGICAVALLLSHHVGLGGARLLVALLVVAGAVASVTDDIAAGDTSFSPGYLTFMYLLAVVAVPYRPVQTLLLGAILTITLYLAIEKLPALVGGAAVDHDMGHYIYLTIMSVALTGASGLLYAVRYGQYRARREAERLHEQVQAVEGAKSRFFTNISHEFRTPLTLLLGPLEDALADRYGPLDPRLRRRVQEMHTQAYQLHDLIDQLLDVSKLEAGAMPLRVRQHDLAVFVQRQAEFFRSAAERQGITLLVETPQAPLPVWFDAEKLGRVVSNLLSNALKHTPAEGTVRVRVAPARTASEAVLAVRDSGEGLAQDALATVFDRFASGHRVPEGQTSTGVGLALVKEIVERHGGSVEVASEPGFGAEFVVRFPLGDSHIAPGDRDEAALPTPSKRPLLPPVTGDTGGTEAVHSDPPEAVHSDPPEEAPLVLVADDHAPMRAYLRDLLGGEYRVLEAADGAEAWAFVREHRPDLVISDVMMPKLDGFALCRQIRADEHLATIPVVLLTARAEEEARLEGWKTGADAYLTKPFSGAEVSIITEHLIEVRQLLQVRVKAPEWMATKDDLLPASDAEFLNRVQQVVGAHIGDSDFGVEWLAEEVGLSARQLQRRLKERTRLTAAGFIKAMRLEHAARLLEEHDLQVQEVARAVGYEDVSYFSRLFREVYGMPPSEYGKEAT